MSVYICESVNLNGEASDEASPFSLSTIFYSELPFCNLLSQLTVFLLFCLVKLGDEP